MRDLSHDRGHRIPGALLTAAWFAAIATASLPLLYVASFAYFFADDWFGWGMLDSLDEESAASLLAFYWPLIWLCNAIIG